MLGGCSWVVDGVSNRKAKRQRFREKEEEKKSFLYTRSISMYKNMSY